MISITLTYINLYILWLDAQNVVRCFQLKVEEDQGVYMTSVGLTLRKLVVWMSEPLVKMKALASLVDICQGASRDCWMMPYGSVQTVCIYQLKRQYMPMSSEF